MVFWKVGKYMYITNLEPSTEPSKRKLIDWTAWRDNRTSVAEPAYGSTVNTITLKGIIQDRPLAYFLRSPKQHPLWLPRVVRSAHAFQMFELSDGCHCMGSSSRADKLVAVFFLLSIIYMKQQTCKKVWLLCCVSQEKIGKKTSTIFSMSTVSLFWSHNQNQLLRFNTFSDKCLFDTTSF